MAYENYTIRQFENAMFRNDRTVMNEEEFQTVYTEYIDTAGLYETEEFQKVSYISYLNNRINSIKLGIRLQTEFLEEFGVPFIHQFSFFKKFGHKLVWKRELGILEQREDFYQQLHKIQLLENKYTSQLENKIKELKDYRDKKNKKKVVQKDSKAYDAWVRTINSLRKNGWKLDKDVERVDELAHIIKQQTEINEDLKAKK